MTARPGSLRRAVRLSNVTRRSPGDAMLGILDPERVEMRMLQSVAHWSGLSVLDIGCGDGRLSLRLARLGAVVVGIDADASDIRAARRRLPARYRTRVRYEVESGTRLTCPDEAFDVVLFSWSL